MSRLGVDALPMIVKPYTAAKQRYFPEEAPGEPADIALLTEIRDLLASGRTGQP